VRELGMMMLLLVVLDCLPPVRLGLAGGFGDDEILKECRGDG
jgi:hypothetical protein